MKELKLGPKKQESMFTRVFQESEAVVRASYVLSELLAKSVFFNLFHDSKPFIKGTFVKECIIKVAEILQTWQYKKHFQSILSRNTVVELKIWPHIQVLKSKQNHLVSKDFLLPVTRVWTLGA